MKDLGLDSLDCGFENYLEMADEELVAILGHPDCEEPTDVRPLRLSFGTERDPNKTSTPLLNMAGLKQCLGKRFKTSPKKISESDINNYLFYDNDTLEGNSGSPVVGRGDKNSYQAYCVKGIHVKSFSCSPNTNAAQKIIDLNKWIDLGINYSG